MAYVFMNKMDAPYSMVDEDTRPAKPARTRLGRALRRGMARSFHIESRRDQIAMLGQKTDAELAALGLRRDQIVRHVFRDIIGA